MASTDADSTGVIHTDIEGIPLSTSSARGGRGAGVFISPYRQTDLDRIAATRARASEILAGAAVRTRVRKAEKAANPSDPPPTRLRTGGIAA